MPAVISPLPLYSQYLDVKKEEWRRRACGIVALKSIFDHFEIKSPAIDELIEEACRMGAYNARQGGWLHHGLVAVAARYGIMAYAVDCSNDAEDRATDRLRESVECGPCIVLIHKDFDRKNSDHLIAVRRISAQYVFYNESASWNRRRIPQHVSLWKFIEGWRRRFICFQK